MKSSVPPMLIVTIPAALKMGNTIEAFIILKDKIKKYDAKRLSMSTINPISTEKIRRE